jgi:hypothetical protein
MADNPFTAGFKKAFGIRPAGGDGASAQPFGPQSQIVDTTLDEDRVKSLSDQDIHPTGNDGVKTLLYTRKLLNAHGHPDTVLMTDRGNKLLEGENGKQISVQAIAVRTGDGEKLIIVPKKTQEMFEKDPRLMNPIQAHEVGHHVMGMRDPSEGNTPEDQKAIFHENEFKADKFGACVAGNKQMIDSLRAMAKINGIRMDEESDTHPSIDARKANIQKVTKNDCEQILGRKSGSVRSLPVH